jgi:hypothetical protein
MSTIFYKGSYANIGLSSDHSCLPITVNLLFGGLHGSFATGSDKKVF